MLPFIDFWLLVGGGTVLRVVVGVEMADTFIGVGV